MKVRKKPVIVEAYQWFKNGDHPEDDVFRPFEDTGVIPTDPREGKVVRYYRHPNVPGETACSKCGRIMHDHGWIDTLEDGHNVCPGDWIITGIKGEKYPCKPDIFAQTYEAVVDVEILNKDQECTDYFYACAGKKVCLDFGTKKCTLSRNRSQK